MPPLATLALFSWLIPLSCGLDLASSHLLAARTHRVQEAYARAGYKIEFREGNPLLTQNLWVNDGIVMSLCVVGGLAADTMHKTHPKLANWLGGVVVSAHGAAVVFNLRPVPAPPPQPAERR